MAFRGERFDIDLSSDEDGLVGSHPSYRKHGGAPAPVLPSFVKDVAERPSPRSANPPTAPTPHASPTGFPAHTKRTGASKFKQARTDPAASIASEKTQNSPSTLTQTAQNDASGLSHLDRQEIDKENRERLANMSAASIAKERQELMEGLSPSLIQRLLRRANIDETKAADFPARQTAKDSPGHATGLEEEVEVEEELEEEEGEDSSEPAPPSSILDTIPPPSSTHFPPAPQPPPLDPSSPNFLADLHEKYFPNLPHDPSKLSWMNPSDTSTTSLTAAANGGQTNPQTYDPSSQDLPISALRFSFTGALLPPSTSQSIPVSKGLHHHGDAPDAAGYTIGELAHLARSRFPSQRCFAFQTLGRVLYRLGIGEFGRLERGLDGAETVLQGGDGEEDDDEGEDKDPGEGLAKGLWDCVRQGRVLETLEQEAGRAGGHVSAKAYAVEALWLWRKGGGTEVRAT